MYVYRCPKCPPAAARVALASDVLAPQCAALAHGGQLVAMELLRDDAQALLPIDGAPTIGPCNVETLKAAGILLPATQDALDWLYRHRARNGMEAAFLKVGGRRCIDLVAFAKAMRERKA